MKISHLTLFLTEACNFSCSYCPREKRNRHMSKTTAERTLLHFLPRFSKAPVINFYGGEPLLRFDLLMHVVDRLRSDRLFTSIRPRFALTTNGSLVTAEVLDFLERHRFSVTLSYDGPRQDIRRSKGSGESLSRLAARMAVSRRLDFEINTVVTPADAGYIPETVRCLLDLGARNIRLSPALHRPWGLGSRAAYRRGMGRLRRCLIDIFGRTGHIPVLNFRDIPRPGLFRCGAGTDRAAVTTQGDVWGCHLFADFAAAFPPGETRKYFMGRVDDPPGHSRLPEISALEAYARISQDNFAVNGKSCLFCPDADDCSVCPLSAAAPGRPLGSIPLYACDLQRIRIAEVRRFHDVVNRRA